MSDLTDVKPEDRERLEREANLVRGRLATTLDVLDKRRHDLMDVKLQVRRFATPIALGGGLIGFALLTGIGYLGYRIATIGERRRRERAHVLQRMWNHPERVARYKNPPMLLEIGRKLLVGTVTYVGMSLLRRALKRPVLREEPMIGRAPIIP